MEDKDLKVLNAKLLKFAGFTDIKDAKFAPVWHSAKFPADSDLKDCYAPSPNLVEDANAQIKWLYPKLKEGQCYIAKKYNYESNDFAVFIYRLSKIPIESVGQKYETIAFALAIEKYIDLLGKENGI